jgi:hypothetical protein
MIDRSAVINGPRRQQRVVITAQRLPEGQLSLHDLLMLLTLLLVDKWSLGPRKQSFYGMGREQRCGKVEPMPEMTNAVQFRGWMVLHDGYIIIIIL